MLKDEDAGDVCLPFGPSELLQQLSRCRGSPVLM